jgi:hypothetical protein
MCDWYYRYHERWTDEEERKLLMLRNQGLTWNEIARKIVGRSEIACRIHYYSQKNKHDPSFVSEQEKGEQSQNQFKISGVMLVDGKLVFV